MGGPKVSEKRVLFGKFSFNMTTCSAGLKLLKIIEKIGSFQKISS